MIGPTLHYNFGGGLKQFSWGLEFSYWNWENEIYPDSPPIGFDLGFEFEKNKKRFYTEFQTGELVGASLGYVFEFGNEINKGGFQGSLWASYYGGLELRYRRLNKKNFISPGLILKFPLYERYPKLDFGNLFGNLI